jgi:hypothetical protein
LEELENLQHVAIIVVSDEVVYIELSISYKYHAKSLAKKIYKPCFDYLKKTVFKSICSAFTYREPHNLKDRECWSKVTSILWKD